MLAIARWGSDGRNRGNAEPCPAYRKGTSQRQQSRRLPLFDRQRMGIAKKHSPAGEMGFADGTVSFAIYRQM